MKMVQIKKHSSKNAARTIAANRCVAFKTDRKSKTI